METLSTIGRRLNHLFAEGNATQRQVAELIGVSDATMSRYINNKKVPSDDVLAAICTLFDANPLWLRYGLDYPMRSKGGLPLKHAEDEPEYPGEEVEGRRTTLDTAQLLDTEYGPMISVTIDLTPLELVVFNKIAHRISGISYKLLKEFELKPVKGYAR